MDVTERDFDLIWESAMVWGPHWASHDGRFIRVDDQSTALPPFDCRMVYWFGQRWVEVMAARAFLDAQGCRYFVLWDTGLHPSGLEMGFMIVTDFVAEGVLEGDE